MEKDGPVEPSPVVTYHRRRWPGGRESPVLVDLQRFLDRPVGQMSVRELLLVGVAAGVAIILVGKVRRYRLRRGLAAQTVEVRCGECHWHGRTGRYVRRCPKCGAEAIQTERLPRS